ncbi:hypothetical protein ZIOFF_011607 [Zingiber officinale]|uniref:Uncharacterized protein n=1 Tax=Zingiber officinale TaxID=94328 RepID=A0A8J5HNE2_ZINOF|nr:hypothetical protein ZIOFF_011607 [Zingiber officinale]
MLKEYSFAELHFASSCFSYSDGIANLLLQHTVLWKVAGKLIMTKPKGLTSEIKKAPSSGLKWSFSPGTNLLSGGAAKLEKESRQKLNEFSKELRTFRSVDLSGRNFGDDGLFFLTESLGYNRLLKAAEEVDFSGNGITAVGLKALDGVLQTNTILKTAVSCLSDILKVNECIQKLQLNSSGIGDEGARVIADMLKENQTLCVLELNNNMIEYSVLPYSWAIFHGFVSLAGALVENKAIRSIHLKLIRLTHT